MQDSFMRTDIFKDSQWEIHSGQWELHKHGNGIAETEEDLESHKVERAVNPYTVFGDEG